MGRKRDGDYVRKRGANMFIFFVYLIFGLYFINSTFGFITFPEFVFDIDIDKWIIFGGGILIILGGLNYLRAGKKSRLR